MLKLKKFTVRVVSSFQLSCYLVFTSACSVQPTTVAPSPAAKPADAELQVIIDAHWQDTLKRSPVFATTLGVRDYDQRLGSLSVAAMDAEAEAVAGFLARLRSLDTAALSDNARLNRDLLARELENTLAKAKYSGRLMLFTNRGGWHINFARLPERLPFKTLADYQSYLARLRDFPRYNAEGIATLREGIKTGYTQPCESMAGFDKSIRSHAQSTVADSIFIRPFKQLPKTLDPELAEALRSDAEQVIAQQVLPAYRRLLNFYQQEYNPACRKASGLYGLAGAAEYYAFLAKNYTTTQLSPQQIHDIGLGEVARINAEMQQVMTQVKFKGDRQAFNHFLRTDPQFYPKTPEEHLKNTAYISKKADGGLPALFSRLPRMPYTVKPVPEDIAEKTTTAYYEPPAGDGSRAGVYRINLSKLNTRPLFEMEALSLHEAVPGHHLQIALAQELQGLPAFRRFGGETAFIEGWGLYAERLGLEMGFYTDPYSNFGRLSYEMWRACRLVVDTGLHALGWSRQQAIDYMAKNTALSLHNIESEVDRYITWPGQALAYKIGELKIRELRQRAEKTLGEKFDVRAFHEVLLQQGALPLEILEQQVDKWLASF